MESNDQIKPTPQVPRPGQYRNVETYAGDMARVIEGDSGGLIKKIIHGEEQHEEEKRNLSPESKKNKIFMFTSVILIAAACVVLSFFLFKNQNNTVTIAPQFTPLIFTDKSAMLEVADMNKEEVAAAVAKEVQNTEVKKGGLEGIYLTEGEKIIGLRRFLKISGSNFVLPENISGSVVVGDNFLMGAVNGESKNFFILLKVRSTADVFNALRTWEGKIFADLHNFFGISITPDTNYLFTKEFQDGVVENKNARILYDNTNNIVLMYIFADDNSVVITNNLETASEVMLRIVGARDK